MSSFLIGHGLDVAVGVTVVLLVGALVTSVGRTPIHRFVVARFTLVATWVVVALLVIPLPRPARLTLDSLAQESWSEGAFSDRGPVVLAKHTAFEPQTFDPVPLLPMPGDVWDRGPSVMVEPPSDLHPLRPVDPVPAAMQNVTAVRAEHGTEGTEPTAAEPLAAPGARVGVWIARAFLVGAALFALHLLVCAAVLARTLRRARAASRTVVERATGWGASSGTRILESDDVQRPFCWGVTHGVVVLPAGLARRNDEVLLEAVLRHEIAHLEQRHPAARLIAAASAPLLYWNPLYWWLARELRRSAEILADDSAAASIDKRCYVSSLLSLAERSAPSFPAPGIGVLGSRREFLLRMESLLMRKHRLSTSTSSTHLVARCTAGAVLLGAVSVALGNAPLQDEPVQAETAELESVQVELPQERDQELSHQQGVPSESTQHGAFHSDEQLSKLLDPEFTPGFSFGRGAAPNEYVRHVRNRYRAAMSKTIESGNRSQIVRAHESSEHQCRLVAEDLAALGRFLIVIDDAPLRIGRLNVSDGVGGIRNVEFILENGTLEQLVGVTSKIDDLSVVEFVSVSQQHRAGYGLSRESEFGLARDYKSKASQYFQIGLDDPDIDGAVTDTGTGADKGLVTLNCGHASGVREGMEFEVFSGAKYKGKVRVESVSKNASMARVVLMVDGGTFEVGDNVTTKL